MGIAIPLAGPVGVTGHDILRRQELVYVYHCVILYSVPDAGAAHVHFRDPDLRCKFCPSFTAGVGVTTLLPTSTGTSSWPTPLQSCRILRRSLKFAALRD